MFQGSKGKTMKWGTLLKDLREKVGLTQSPSSSFSASATASSSSSSAAALSSNNNANSALHGSYSPSRSTHFLVFQLLII